jgi:hypothetical protein
MFDDINLLNKQEMIPFEKFKIAKIENQSAIKGGSDDDDVTTNNTDTEAARSSIPCILRGTR